MTSLLLSKRFRVDSEYVEAHLVCPYTSVFPQPPPGQELSLSAPYPPSSPYQAPSKSKERVLSNLSRSDLETDEHHARIISWLDPAIKQVTGAWRQKQPASPWWNLTFVQNHVIFDHSTHTGMLIGRPQGHDNIIPWVEWENALHTILFALDDWPNSAEEFVYLNRSPWKEMQPKDNTIHASKSFTSIFHNPHMNLSAKPIFLYLSKDISLYIPPMSGFCISSMEYWSRCNLKQLGAVFGGWDLIVIDPPWPNKSISRSASYQAIDIYDLFKFELPVSDATTKTLVCVWVTNKAKFRRFVLNKLFPSWGVRSSTISEWYWVKITAHGPEYRDYGLDLWDGGEPVWPLTSKHRLCYEGVITGFWTRDNNVDAEPLPRTVFLSTPLQHSRKPILTDLVRPYLDKIKTSGRKGLNYLELFARGISGSSNRDDFTMAIGNEAVAFNQVNKPHTPQH